LASSVFINLAPADNMIEISISKNTPWYDNEYVIYRLNNSSGIYDSIDYTSSRVYTDRNLKNGDTYCYKVKSVGVYNIGNDEFPTENLSQESCQVPMDYQRPCPPFLNVRSSCDSLKNVLTWNNPNLTCADDVIAYKIYYTSNANNPLDSILRIEGAENTFFEHFPDGAMGACYAVTAVDSFQNESEYSLIQCVDNCSYYLLPNVFTPNGDGINDVYVAINPMNYVKKVNMKIFNRWGELLFETDNPLIEWDGRIQSNNKMVSPGVYYYLCDVWEPRISGLEQRNLVGFIHVYTQAVDGVIINE